MNADDLHELIGVFVAETHDFIQVLETNLLAMETSLTSQSRLQLVKEMFRAAHSIKGSALMFEMNELSQVAHCLEDSFAILRDQVDLSDLKPEIITALLEGLNLLKAVVDLEVKNKELGGSHDGYTRLSNSQQLTSHACLNGVCAIKKQLEIQYGNPEILPTIPGASPPNLDLIKLIFDQELPPVFQQLETAFAQATSATLAETITTLNQICYQLSGVAGMLHLPELATIATSLKELVNTPDLDVKTLQLTGTQIVENLQIARTQVIAGLSITVPPITNSSAEEINPLELTSTVSDPLAPDSPIATEMISPSSDSIPTPNQTYRPTIRVDLERLTDLINLVGELVINRTNLELQENQLRIEVKRMRRHLGELKQFDSILRDEYDRLSIGNLELDGEGEFKPKKSRSFPNFDPLELDQYTEFHASAGEVIELSHAIAQSAGKIDEVALQIEVGTIQLRRITEQLRSRVMQLRVVNFGRAVDHLPRALRQLSVTYNKEVNLVLLGRDTKIDESLINALRDPLVHLVRNAFDHGIEPPEVRKAVGKSPTGTIEIQARHQGGQTIITVSDDGKGIDPEAIRTAIVTKGFATTEQAKELAIADLYEFLFWSGFSTNTETTDLSGRGVGLDVVRNNLRQVRGQVKVDSRPGKGTSFILKLPLMLSITEALMVRVDRNIIAVPLDAVEEILHLRAEQIQMAGNQPMLRWRDEFIRLVPLQNLLHYSIPHPDRTIP